MNRINLATGIALVLLSSSMHGRINPPIKTYELYMEGVVTKGSDF